MATNAMLSTPSPSPASSDSTNPDSPRSRRVHFTENSSSASVSVSDSSSPLTTEAAASTSSLSTAAAASNATSLADCSAATEVLQQALALEKSGRFLSSTLFYQFLLQHRLSSSGLAEWKLGCRYADGYGLQEDRNQAEKLWKKAADKGHKAAAAVCQWRSAGATEFSKRQEALKLLEEYVHEHGHDDADAEVQLLHLLTEIYSVNEPPISLQKSLLAQFSSLATRGHAVAQWRLGCFYFHGQWMWKDVARAVVWWRKATEQRYEPAVKAIKEVEAGNQRNRHVSETRRRGGDADGQTKRKQGAQQLDGKRRKMVGEVRTSSEERENESDSSEGMEEMSTHAKQLMAIQDVSRANLQ